MSRDSGTSPARSRLPWRLGPAAARASLPAMRFGRDPSAPASRGLPERALRAVPFACAAIAFAGYAATAARTITWWDGSSYPLAAVTLGIPGAPGSLLLTLLG